MFRPRHLNAKDDPETVVLGLKIFVRENPTVLLSLSAIKTASADYPGVLPLILKDEDLRGVLLRKDVEPIVGEFLMDIARAAHRDKNAQNIRLMLDNPELKILLNRALAADFDPSTRKVITSTVHDLMTKILEQPELKSELKTDGSALGKGI